MPSDQAPDRHDIARLHADNRAAWNQAAEHYEQEHDERVARLRAGTSSVHAIERANLARFGPLADWCGRAIHLQCASGEDTLSLLLEGAREVVGVDIADLHVRNAERTTEALAADPGAPFAGAASWHRADALDPPAALDGTADLVDTGRGALAWLHDLAAWGRTVARLLRPGGVLSVLEDHPASYLFEFDATRITANGDDYFEAFESSRGWPEVYVGDLGRPEHEHALKHERAWTLAAVHTACTEAGLAVVHLGEHAASYWNAFPNLPADERRKLPLSFSLLAVRPG